MWWVLGAAPGGGCMLPHLEQAADGERRPQAPCLEQALGARKRSAQPAA
jgi:hypothetical protein